MSPRKKDSRVSVYLGIGSNVGTDEEKLARLRLAVAEIAKLPNSTLEQVAPLYWAVPWGVTDQPDFFNSALCLRTAASPEAVLAHCKSIETAIGRQPRERWGEREIDVDILLYGDQVIQKENLVIPHPHLLDRDFVVLPLLELNPQLLLPDGRTLADAAPLFKLGDTIRRINDDWTSDYLAGE